LSATSGGARVGTTTAAAAQRGQQRRYKTTRRQASQDLTREVRAMKPAVEATLAEAVDCIREEQKK